jgi:hypothetical protein
MYKVAMRNNATGEVRVIEEHLDWRPPTDDSQGSAYWHLDGNMECDCNREWDWVRVNDPDDDNTYACGSERFSIMYVELPDGTRPLEYPDGDRAFEGDVYVPNSTDQG